MVSIVILINVVEPPAVAQAVQHVFSVVNIAPCVTTDATALCILGRENGCNGQIDVDSSGGIFVYLLHTFVVSLYTGMYALVVITVCFYRTMRHKVDLYIAKPFGYMAFNGVLYTGKY